MSGMTLGGMIEADRRLREYEGVVRRRKRSERDQLVWRKWEGLVEAEPRGESAGASQGTRMEPEAKGVEEGGVVDVVGRAGAGGK